MGNFQGSYTVIINCSCGGFGNDFQVKWEYIGYYYYYNYFYLDDVKVVKTCCVPEYAELIEDVVVPAGGEIVVQFPDWTPSDWGDPAYECVDVNYCIRAFTILLDDENSSNDCKVKYVTLRLDSEPPVINFYFSIPIGFGHFCLGIINLGWVSDDCCGVDRVEWFVNGAPWPPATPGGGFIWRWRPNGNCADTITIQVFDRAGNHNP
jgi:hypothetical protein